MSKVIHADKNNLESLIENDLVLVDFYAEWCGPCKLLGPILDELSNEVRAKIVKVNVDDNPELSQKYGVKSIPTMIVFKNGEIIDQMIGSAQKSVLKSKLESY